VSRFIEALRHRHRLVRDRGERGTTLVEVIVGMSIMTVCGAIFLGSAVTLSRVTAKTQAVTTTASQTNLAYLSLDRTVRYASAIASPGKGASGNWYVEFRDTTSGSEVCTQLRIDNATKQLGMRTWSASNPPVVPAVFRQISTGFTNGTAADTSADRPFILKPDPLRPTSSDSKTAEHQRLLVTLRAVDGFGATSSTSDSSFTLTALNSTRLPAGPVCTQGGRP